MLSLLRSYAHIVPKVVSRSVHDIRISSCTAREIATRFRVKQSPYDYEEHLNSLTELAARTLKEVLPSTDLKAIEEVKTGEKGFVVITGIPCDPDLMDTPYDLSLIRTKKSTFYAELFSMGIAGILGQEIYNFRQEGWGTGDLIFNIFPKKNMLNIKGAGGVGNDFRYHMENAWHSQAPDSLLLKGLRPDHDNVAETYVVANRTIYDQLSVEDQNILKTHTFRILPPEIHKKMENEQGILLSEDQPYLGPAIVEEDTGLKFMINFNGMEPVGHDLAAEEALRKLERIAFQSAAIVKLSGDNLVVLNNKRALHTRNGYAPRFDGKDRWFQRYFLLDKANLWRFLPVTNQDFSSLSSAEKEMLLKYLEQEKVVVDGKLTSKFQPHDRNYKLPLPVGLEAKRQEITKILLRKGPAYPHRVV